jgi:membrane fusion protein (multidrug efflux system)
METQKKEKDGAPFGAESPFAGIAGDIPDSPPVRRSGHGKWFLRWSPTTLLLAGASVAAGLFILLGILWLEKANRRLTLNDALVQGETVPVSAVIEGKILSMAVAEGDRVKAGEVVAQLQNSQYKSQVTEAQEQVRKAEIQRSKAERGLEDLKKRVPLELNQATKAVEASRSRLKAAETRMQGGSVESDRGQVVYRSGPDYVRRKQERELSRKTAKSEVLAAKKELQRNEARLQAIKAKKNLMDTKQRFAAAAKVRLQRAQSSLDTARNNLAATTITAPISGIVSKRAFTDGDLVKSGDTVAVVVDANRLWLEARVTEADLKSISIGQTVNVKFDAYPDKLARGTVVAIGAPLSQPTGPPAEARSPVGDGKSTVGFPLRVELSQPEQQLRPGMKASITIDARRS